MKSLVLWGRRVSTAVTIWLCAATAAYALPEALHGTWKGVYCGNSDTTWRISTQDPKRAFATERWCNAFSCGNLDFKLNDLAPSTGTFTAIAGQGSGFSVSGFSIRFTLSADGRRLDGKFVDHPRCSNISMTKQSADPGSGPAFASSWFSLPSTAQASDRGRTFDPFRGIPLIPPSSSPPPSASGRPTPDSLIVALLRPPGDGLLDVLLKCTSTKYATNGASWSATPEVDYFMLGVTLQANMETFGRMVLKDTTHKAYTSAELQAATEAGQRKLARELTSRDVTAMAPVCREKARDAEAMHKFAARQTANQKLPSDLRAPTFSVAPLRKIGLPSDQPASDWLAKCSGAAIGIGAVVGANNKVTIPLVNIIDGATQDMTGTQLYNISQNIQIAALARHPEFAGPAAPNAPELVSKIGKLASEATSEAMRRYRSSPEDMKRFIGMCIYQALPDVDKLKTQ